MYVPRFIGRLLECAWYFNLDAINKPWYFYHVDENDFICQHFYYKTGWDYLIGNKVLVRDYWDEHLDRLFVAAGFKNLDV